MAIPSHCPTVPLSSGHNIPILGLGMSHHGGYSHDALLYSLRSCGIRHIDTAKRYGNEELVGKAISESGVKREELWITTKLWPDLYLMHWPDAHIPGKSSREARADTWKALEDLYYRGICHSIGVSNFLIHHLEELKEDCDVVPHLNQVEYHPFQRPQELVDYCKRNNIVFGGYCPLAKGQALTHPVILRLAKQYGKTPAQICIRWSIQNGIVTIPKSTKESRILENCQVFDFHLRQADMMRICSLHCNKKLIHLTYPLWKG
ncbi:putative oxidoreductase ZK1290.5 isoform 3-T3 [Leptodactylus fuscus]|uniref:putative oxidoreductase ZK1290.5 isoform X3 n=1 Tax=Leptodactylus fuscus TaxID=238119 RepID=UPI003F4EE21D